MIYFTLYFLLFLLELATEKQDDHMMRLLRLEGAAAQQVAGQVLLQVEPSSKPSSPNVALNPHFAKLRSPLTRSLSISTGG